MSVKFSLNEVILKGFACLGMRGMSGSLGWYQDKMEGGGGDLKHMYGRNVILCITIFVGETINDSSSLLYCCIFVSSSRLKC